jgi:aryl-alcohol dehydrogenase-like predicted oxidoreductase
MIRSIVDSVHPRTFFDTFRALHGSAIMKLRQLGKTGIQVSEIGVGAWQLGGPLLLDGKNDGHPDLGHDFVVDLIRQAGEMGINFVDTAEQYGAGESERRVGEALAGQRDRWIIGTKFGAFVGGVPDQRQPGTPSGKRVNDPSVKRIPISLENSLRRLKTDRIDVYVYHCNPDPKETEGVTKFLESARKQGKVRAVGISTNDLKQIEYLRSLNCLDVVQFAQNMMDQQADLTAYLAKYQIGGVVRGAFAVGKLSGRYFRSPPNLPETDIRSNWFKYPNLAEDFAKFAAFEVLLSAKRSMPQLALRWLLDQPTTHTIIMGAKTVQQYRDAAAATELPRLTPAELEKIAEIRAALAR